ncbi:MAG: hypothetical protein HZB38_05715 [Planctomycetes bacterium]|nr:hypothetical protein [Planctomycetota bacterium]
MSRISGRRLAACLAWVLASWIAIAHADANIDLKWRKPAQSVCPGDLVEVGLYAVSDSGNDQLLSAIDLAFVWDPAYLHLLGLSQTGAVPLLASFFPANDPFGINEVVPPQDGTGLYSAYAPFGAPVAATPGGVLITTFRFQALQSTTSATLIEMRSTLGSPPATTAVWSGTSPGTPVTGTLMDARVGITFQICPSDLNDDQLVDLLDLTLLLSSFGLNNGGALDCDGDTDLNDLTLLLSGESLASCSATVGDAQTLRNSRPDGSADGPEREHPRS